MTTGMASMLSVVTPRIPAIKVVVWLPDSADAYGAVLAGNTVVANVDIIVARNVGACADAQGDVVVASRVDIARVQTDGRVEVTGHII